MWGGGGGGGYEYFLEDHIKKSSLFSLIGKGKLYVFGQVSSVHTAMFCTFMN